MGKSYKLYYFPARGRAEVSRLAFAAAGVKYEDIRIAGTEWPKRKAEMPLGQMPVLEVDGVKHCQSKAIRGYLAREFNLYGKDNDEAFQIDVIIDTLGDIAEKYPFTEKDEAKKAELKKKFTEEIAPKGMQTVEKLLIDYNGGDGFMVSKLSVADLEFVSMCDFLLPMNKNVLDCVPKLKGLYKRVNAIPNIKKWVEERPKTEF